MKIKLCVPKPDWIHTTTREFDLSSDAIKALLHSYREFIKTLPKKFGVNTEINQRDPKTNQEYRFLMNQEWLDACKALDDYPANYVFMQTQLTKLDKITELCEEAFDLYKSWYFSGGGERVEAMIRIKNFLQSMSEKEEKNPLKMIKAVLGCLISERDTAIEQHTSQLIYPISFFSAEKPKFALALEPVINVYKALLEVPHEKEFRAEFGRQSPAKIIVEAPESKKEMARARI
ncbi:MAG: hypothetical protein ACYCQI_13020 [Gammaproteobacteria bacterium]